MGKLIDGKKIAEKILQKTTKQVKILQKQGVKPKLAVVLVGEDQPSQTYVRKKAQAAQKCGIDFALYKFPAKISQKKLIAEIEKIQTDKKLSGLIVQLPLPEPLYTTAVLNAINPAIDVDCLTDTNIGKLIMNTYTLLPPTPDAVLEILKFLKAKIRGKNIVIIGTGALVGKPLSIILNNLGATVIACNKETKNIKDKCLKAEIIITAVGKKKNLLTADMIKKGAIVIDTGILFVNGKMQGDVDFANVKNKAGWITPVPGGVGPITVAKLLENVVRCAVKNKT